MSVLLVVKKEKGWQNVLGESSSRDVNLHKLIIHKIAFKNKGLARAIREIKAFTAKIMLTKDVRIDTPLNNKFINWSNGLYS